MLLDVRIYTVHAGKRAEFDALVRNETIPMARRYGQRIVAFEPSAHDDDTYYLMRAFSSAEDRNETLVRFYNSDEWRRKYDDRVVAFIDSYQTAVLPTSPEAVQQLTEASRASLER